MEEESASKRQKSSLSLSLSSEWDMSDLSSFRSWVVSGAKKKEEKLSSGSAPLAESPVASPAVSNSSSSLCNIVADESDEEAEKVLLDDSSGWHWLSFGRPPLKTVNPQNEALVASLKALASFYKLFPDSVQLGPQKQRNDLRALKCRAIYNFVRGAEIRICKADQLAHVKGIKKSWREKIDCLIDHGELDVQKQRRNEAVALKLFQRVLWTGPATSWDWYSKGYSTLEDVRNHAHLNQIQKLGLQYVDDINSPIPRSEVECYEQIVRSELKQIDPQLSLHVFGSYCRKEDPCSDIDFLVSHAEVGRERGAVEELLSRLKKKGLVISFLNPGKILPNFKNGQCDKDSWWESMPSRHEHEMFLHMIVARLNPNSKVRRVDFFSCSRNAFAPVSLYLTGNVWFNRKMREFASKKGFYLCNSAFGKVVGKNDGSKGIHIVTKSQQEIFRILEIDWVEPEHRNY